MIDFFCGLISTESLRALTMMCCSVCTIQRLQFSGARIAKLNKRRSKITTSAQILEVPPSPEAKKQLIRPGPGRAYYFGFGANLSPTVMARRNLKPKMALVGYAPGYQLFFQHIGGAAA